MTNDNLGELGAMAEKAFGALRRNPNEGLDFITGGGRYLEVFGLPKEQAADKTFNFAKTFLPSIDRHFRKIGKDGKLLLDVRYMSDDQFKTTMDYINSKYSDRLNQLYLLKFNF